MYKRILVPVDGSPTSHRGLDEAIKLAKLCNGQVRLVHVVDELIFTGGTDGVYFDYPSVVEALCTVGKRVLSDAQAKVRAAGVSVETEMIECIGTRASDLIVKHAQAWPADVIVMGTHGRRGIGRWALGSDAESVLRSAPVPVLLVRASS